MAGRLKGKVAIVSGAGSSGPGWGNGKAAAVAFAREGAQVFAVDLNPEAAADTVSIISEEGGRGIAHAADVSDPAAVESMQAEDERYHPATDSMRPAGRAQR
jgi:NAD(P)-dependent dehydrogenase (short-subunit alcohol dehydrogenase family)